MSAQYINIASDALKALFKNKITEYDRKVYFTICHHATFKHQVFGIYERKSFHTLRNLVKALTGDDKQIVHLQRSIARLEAAGLLKLLFQSREIEPLNGIKPPPTELIISLDPAATLQSICTAIEQNIEDFNIYAGRIRELERNLGVKLNFVKKTASKLVAITNAELDEDSKIAGELFPAQLQVVPDTALISFTMESASAGVKYFPRRTSVP